MRGCQYQAVSGGGSVSVFTAAGDLVRLLVRVKQRFGDAVEGVGDQAFPRGEMVVVIRGDMAVSIRVQAIGSPTGQRRCGGWPGSRPGAWPSRRARCHLTARQ